MRRKWSYLKWSLWRKRSAILGITAFFIAVCILFANQNLIWEKMKILYTKYGVRTAGSIIEIWVPHSYQQEDNGGYFLKKPKVLEYMEQIPKSFEQGEDPAYKRLLTHVREVQILRENEKAMESDDTQTTSIPTEPVADQIKIETSDFGIIREKLTDFDYLMKEFYVIHPTTAVDGSLINADRFLNTDLSLKKETNVPQILIYHTHSQETFSDHTRNQEATVVGVGSYLAELLKKRGYTVIHDTAIYDMKNGTLDRSQAYTYALDGINGILQKNPSIEVVLDIHRDGVDENTHLVTEINGKPTARIMFFNGTSQTPDGPIEYLQNPNREANLAFSFQLQLEAAEQYPGFTRKIYLKGLRYNQHVRARTALIEVGAQTNTYAEALNAMEPLADILCRVLEKD